MGIFTRFAARELDLLKADLEHDTRTADLRRHLDTAQAEIERLMARILALQTENETLRRTNKTFRTTLREVTTQHGNERLVEHGEHRAQVARLEAELRGVTARADVAQANFEWNRLMFNKSEAERAMLTQHIVKMPVHAFELDRREGGETRPAVTPSDSNVAVPMGDATQTAIGGLARAIGLDFEDVGDEMARQLGITNNNTDGRLEHA